MIIHEIPHFVQLSYNPEKNYILLDWTDFSVTLEEIKVLHQKALDTVVQKQCFYYIADTSKVKNNLRNEVIQWFGGEWVPKLLSAGLKAVVTVVTDSGLASLSNRTWQAEFLGSLTLKNVKDFSEAEAFIKELQQA